MECSAESSMKWFPLVTLAVIIIIAAVIWYLMNLTMM